MLHHAVRMAYTSKEKSSNPKIEGLTFGETKPHHNNSPSSFVYILFLSCLIRMQYIVLESPSQLDFKEQ